MSPTQKANQEKQSAEQVVNVNGLIKINPVAIVGTTFALIISILISLITWNLNNSVNKLDNTIDNVNKIIKDVQDVKNTTGNNKESIKRIEDKTVPKLEKIDGELQRNLNELAKQVVRRSNR